MSTWPSQLPSSPLVTGYKEEDQDSLIRTDVDAGTTKQRNRFTAIMQKVTEKYVLTEEQYIYLKQDFYRNTLSNGATAFTKTHPVTGIVRLYRFTGPVVLDSVTYPYYNVTLNMEILP